MRWDMYTSAEKMQVLWVCIGLPVLLLAAWLVRDWMDAGGSKKARKAAKALGSKTDEMEHAIITQAQAVAYRVTQAGILACLYYRLLIKGQAAMELCALLVVSGMAEAAIILVQRSCDTLDSVAPPEVTIWSSVPSMSAKSRASPQMRPVETTT